MRWNSPPGSPRLQDGLDAGVMSIIVALRHTDLANLSISVVEKLDELFAMYQPQSGVA